MHLTQESVLLQGRKILEICHILYYHNLTSFLMNVFPCQAHPPAVCAMPKYIDT